MGESMNRHFLPMQPTFLTMDVWIDRSKATDLLHMITSSADDDLFVKQNSQRLKSLHPLHTKLF